MKNLHLPSFLPISHSSMSGHEVKFRDNEELISRKDVQDRFRKEVNEMNRELGEHEKIKRIRLVKEEWSPDTGELSPTQKLKRRIVYDRYADLLTSIYAAGKGEVDFSE